MGILRPRKRSQAASTFSCRRSLPCAVVGGPLWKLSVSAQSSAKVFFVGSNVLLSASASRR